MLKISITRKCSKITHLILTPNLSRGNEQRLHDKSNDTNDEYTFLEYTQEHILEVLAGFFWNIFESIDRPCTVLELLWAKQGKSEGFHSCDRPINLKLDSNRRIFSLCDLEISWMASKNNRALLLYYVELCLSFQIHQWIQSGVMVRKRSIRVEIDNILSGVTLQFDWWPWKPIGHLFYTTLSFVYHFMAMGEFNPELQSRNAQFGSKSAICCPVWPWSLMAVLEKQ